MQQPLLVLSIVVGGILLGSILVILGKLGVKRVYLSIIVGIVVASLLLLAFFIGDHNMSLFYCIYSLFSGLFMGVIAYFSIGIGMKFKGKK
jgi:hypothetical protein